MPETGGLFNFIFPGPLAKGSIGGFRRRLEVELCALLPMRGRAGGRSSIARRFGDDCGEAVIVGGLPCFALAQHLHARLVGLASEHRFLMKTRFGWDVGEGADAIPQWSA